MTIEQPGVAPVVQCPRCGTRNERPRRFCGECGAALGADEPSAPERRHITVLFCDMVGSTALSERLDPEELGELIIAYREVVVASVSRYGGFVARYVGDGILVYFGYPRAHGDDPLRAVHAGREVVQRMAAWNAERDASPALRVSVRIGIHTGLAVVGDLGEGSAREEAGALGETPNLAARIMDLAPVDGVLVSGTTQALAPHAFRWRSWGDRSLEGLSRVVPVFELVDVAQAGTSSRTTRVPVTPLANRTQELSFLQRRWSESLPGRRQAVLITGEPGIGKSRLVRAFADSLAGSRHYMLHLQCSPFFQNSALYPVVDLIRRRVGYPASFAGARLQRLLHAASLDKGDAIPLLASLLGIAAPGPARPLQASARLQRELTMDLLREWLSSLARERPVLVAVEDLQWADASTLELLATLLDHPADDAVLIIAASRSASSDPWGARPEVSRLHVERLTTPFVRELIAHVTEGRALDGALVDEVANRTDGVPLFVEELTKAVLENAGATRDRDGDGDAGIAIPISLHATLMARLDSMNAAKAVAQRAAVLGREFSYELIACTAQLDRARLDDALRQLVDAELLFQFGSPPNATYLFKHSMIQEAAYRSLLRARRRDYHARIAEALVERFPNVCTGQPELVAHHYSQAQRPLDAAPFWRAAGEGALARSANAEAYAHVRRGLDEIAACPISERRLQHEVGLLLAFGSALSALKGSAAPEVEQTYARARDLCRQLDDPRYLFPALRGLHSFYLVRGPLRTACTMIEQLRQIAHDANDPVQRVEADRRLGWCLFCMGNIPAGRELLEGAMGVYDRSQSMRHIMTVGSDPGVIGLANLAWLEALAGRPARAFTFSERALVLARDISYDLGLAYALGMSAALYQSVREPSRASALARETIELASTRGFPYWVAWATAVLGSASAELGDVDVGITMLEKGLEAYRDTGSNLFCPHILGLLAQARARARRYDAALDACEEALAFGDRIDAHFFDAEIARIEGECVLERDRDADSAAEHFRDAIARAQAQGAGMLEMRAIAAMARLERGRGKPPTTLEPLCSAVSRFAGEPECADYQDARQALGLAV